MPTLLVSTVRRHAGPGECTGYLYQVDTDRRQVVARCPIVPPPFLEHDPNARGGLRGARGLAVRDDLLAVANYSAIFLFDPAWRHLATITHPLVAAIHDIAFAGDTLWASSTRNDLAAQFELDGRLIRYFNARADRQLINQLQWRLEGALTAEQIESGQIDFRDPRTHNYENADRGHLNAVLPLENGDVILLLGMLFTPRLIRLHRIKAVLRRAGLWRPIVAVNQSVLRMLRKSRHRHSDLIVQPRGSCSGLVRLKSDGSTELVTTIDEVTAPSHTLLARSGGLALVLDTTRGNVLEFDTNSGRVVRRLNASETFLRGGALLKRDLLVAGSGGELVSIALDEWRAIDRLTVTTTMHETIYAIVPLPPAFSPLPERLEVPERYLDGEIIRTTSLGVVRSSCPDAVD